MTIAQVTKINLKTLHCNLTCEVVILIICIKSPNFKITFYMKFSNNKTVDKISYNIFIKKLI